MLKIALLFGAVSLCSAVIQRADSNLRRVCYHTNWSQYRSEAGKFFPENIDPSLCTHLIYAFAKLETNMLKAFEWNDESTDWMEGMYARFNKLKTNNPDLKTLLAVGGWNMGSVDFTKLCATPAIRHSFAMDSVKFLRDRDFDGLDLDWEYPGNRGSPPEDKQKYTELVKELHNVFEQDANSTGRPRLLLTTAVAAGKSTIDTAYEIPILSRYFDFINLMSYDLHGSWETHTGHNSPLFTGVRDVGDDAYLNMDWAANYWVQQGTPKSKLNIGLGLYGRSFTLRDPSQNGVGAATSGPGTAGRMTREAGFLAYYEICTMIKSGAQVHQIADQRVPYAVQGNQWVGYDDVTSLSLKVQYVKQSGFGGIMVWALDLDDFSGGCGQGKWPLMKAINRELGLPGGSIPHTPAPHTPAQTNHPTPAHTNHPTPAPHPTQAPVTQAPVTQAPPAGGNNGVFSCQGLSNGYFASPTACSEYYICTGGAPFKFNCATGLYWHPTNKYCDWPDNVPCALAPGTQAPVTPAPTQAPYVPPQTNPVHTQPSHTNAQPTNPPTTVWNWPTTTDIFWTPLTGLQDQFCYGKVDGIYADPHECRAYYECASGLTFREMCPDALAFHPQYHVCDYPQNVPSCHNRF